MDENQYAQGTSPFNDQDLETLRIDSTALLWSCWWLKVIYHNARKGDNEGDQKDGDAVDVDMVTGRHFQAVPRGGVKRPGVHQKTPAEEVTAIEGTATVTWVWIIAQYTDNSLYNSVLIKMTESL